MQATDTFFSLLLVQIFYSIAITLLVGSLPTLQTQQLVLFTDDRAVTDLTTMQNSVLTGVSDQQQLPFYDLVALVFFSSNIILTLFINFFTAIPQMLSILLSAIFVFVPVNYFFQKTIQGLFIVFCTIIYYYLVVLFIAGTRLQNSGGIS
jgi:hypothetical protein